MYNHLIFHKFHICVLQMEVHIYIQTLSIILIPSDVSTLRIPPLIVKHLCAYPQF